MHRTKSDAENDDKLGREIILKLNKTGVLRVENHSTPMSEPGSRKDKVKIDLIVTHIPSGKTRYIEPEVRYGAWNDKTFMYETFHVPDRKEKYIDPDKTFFASVNPNGKSFQLINSAHCTDKVHVRVRKGTLKEGQEAFSQYFFDVKKKNTLLVDTENTDVKALVKYLKF